MALLSDGQTKHRKPLARRFARRQLPHGARRTVTLTAPRAGEWSHGETQERGRGRRSSDDMVAERYRPTADVLRSSESDQIGLTLSACGPFGP